MLALANENWENICHTVVATVGLLDLIKVTSIIYDHNDNTINPFIHNAVKWPNIL